MESFMHLVRIPEHGANKATGMDVTRFIHFLPTPTCISHFNGEIVDANQELLVQSKAGTLANIQNFRLGNLFADKAKFNDLVDRMYSGQIVSNYLVLTVNIDKEEDFCFFHGRALSHYLIFKYPNLSNKELNLCAYFALGFSTKEITAISGLTSNALRVHIYNICQKLKLPSRGELSMEMMLIKNGQAHFA